MAKIKGIHLSKMLDIYGQWLRGLDHPSSTPDRIKDILNIFDQVSPSVFSNFVEGMQVVDHKYRYREDNHLLLKIKLDLFEKYLTFDMLDLVEKIVATLNPQTIDVLFTARPEPVAVICQRIVVRQYAVLNQRIEKRLKKFVDHSKFAHCDICGFYAKEEEFELLSKSTMQQVVQSGFHPHNSKRIVQKLADRNKVTIDVITTNEHTLKWLDLVETTEDNWRVCDLCLGEIEIFYSNNSNQSKTSESQ